MRSKKLTQFRPLLFPVLSVLCGAVLLLVASDVFAQAASSSGDPFQKLADRTDTIWTHLVKIARFFFGVSGLVVGYGWTKGKPESRERLEKLAIGIVVAFGIVELINYFA